MGLGRFMRQIFGIVFRPLGTINRDKDFRYLTNGDVTDSFNTRTVTEGGNLGNTRQVIKGNEYVFEPATIQLQNKKFRIYLTDGSYPFPDYLILNLLNPQGVTLATAFQYFSVTFVPVIDIYNYLVNAINIHWTGQSFTIGSFVSTSTTTGYFDLEISTIPYWNYGLSFSGSGISHILTIQEAYDQSLIGDWNLIGSWDLQGELILWWTTQTKLPFDYDILQISNNGSGLFRIETSVAHGLLSNEKVVVKGSGSANGQWIIQVVSATEFDLLGSTYSPVILSSASIVTVDPNGIGELGRAVRDENTQSWTYIRLIRALALNWVTKHQQDTLCKKDALRKTYRYTDDYNPVGTIYDRTINYQNDCLLSFIDPRNTYSYDNIGLESQMILNNASFTFTFTSQSQSGGNILSGNSRAAVRLLTETLVPTAWSPLTDPIPAAQSSETGSPLVWSGDNAAINTPKIDNFLLEMEEEVVNSYKWAQIGIINYQGDALVGLLLPKVLISSTSMPMRWTGNEQTEDLDVGTVQDLTVGYRTALSIDELDGRVILSNLTSSVGVDLSSWTQTFTHSIKRKELPSIGSRFNSSLSINEFEKSGNVYSYAGYMVRERYLLGAEVEFWNGGDSQTYSIQEIAITTEGATYPRRVAGLPDYNLTDVNGSTIYVPYIEISGIDWNFLINGVPVKDIVKKIRIVRVDMIPAYREILGSGVMVMALKEPNSALSTTVDSTDGSQTAGTLFQTYAGANSFGDTWTADGSLITGYANNFKYWEARDAQADRGSVYVPDFMYGESEWTPNNSDFLINYELPSIIAGLPVPIGNSGGAPLYWNNMTEYTGYYGNNGTQVAINDGVNIPYASTGTVGGATYSKITNFSYASSTPLPTYISQTALSNPSSPVVKVNGIMSPSPASAVLTDYGVRAIQVYRPKTDKFGDPLLNRYITTGAEITSDSTSVEVFGGDVFTQKTWIKHRVQADFTQNIPNFVVSGLGGGMAFYSQNRVNTDMTNKIDSDKPWKYPYNDEVDWLNGLFSTEPSLVYNSGYTIRNQVQSYTTFNTDQSLVASDFPVRLIYGEKAQPEQASDTQRIFLPLNFTDLQYKDGEIVNSKVVNSELYSWQPDRFDRLYFYSNAAISGGNGTQVILGSGGAFTNRPNQLSSYGCPNKWLIGIGRSAGGKDVAYWLDPVKKIFARHGGDGTTNQGLIHGLDSFFRDNTSLLIGHDTPADGIGGCFTWNEKFKEAIFTIRTYRTDIAEYVAGKYNEGDLVGFGTVGFEQFPQFYISLVNNNFTAPPDPSWQPIDINNSSFYQIYTFAFSEIKNGFEYFAAFHPKIYAQFRNTYLSPRPISNTGKMYEHERGQYASFYGTQNEGWHYEGVINVNPDEIKSYYGIRVRTLNAPERIDFTTQQQVSYLNQSDFEYREDNYNAGIRMDATVTTTASPDGSEANPTGLADIDTSRLYGDYLRVKQSGVSGIQQSIFNFIVRVRMRVRGKDT